MHNTKIDIAANTRKAAIELLQARLADTVDLITQAKQAHWNVKGPSFIALHDLFEKLAADGREYPDLIAERITTLGGTAEGTAAIAAKRSSLPPYPLDIVDGPAHVEALSTALAAFRQGGARSDRRICGDGRTSHCRSLHGSGARN